jgi:fatty acid-binding protein DegV
MMANVAVLTDSIASLPETFLKSFKITTVAYYIHRGEEVLRDLVTVQREEFLCWIVHAPKGGKVKVVARHERAGVVRTELELK